MPHRLRLAPNAPLTRAPRSRFSLWSCSHDTCPWNLPQNKALLRSLWRHLWVTSALSDVSGFVWAIFKRYLCNLIWTSVASFFLCSFFCLVLREWSHPALSITAKSPRIKFRLQQLRVCSNVMFTFELIAVMEDKCDVIQTVYASFAFYVPVCARVSQFRIWFVLSGDAVWRHQPDVMSSESFIFVLLLHRC